MLRGKTYGEYYDTHRRINDDKLSTLLPPILEGLSWTEGENILDHGCATGRTAAKYFVPLAEKYSGRVYAVDISRSMIERAQTVRPNPRVVYAQSAILDSDFPFANIKFDKIFSLYVMFLDREYRRTLAKMFELLVGGGTAVVMIITRTNLFDCWASLKSQARLRAVGEAFHIPEWIVGGGGDGDLLPHFRRVAEDVGFRVRDLEVIPWKFVFGNKAECAEFFMAAHPNPLETELKDKEMHAQVAEAYEEVLGATEKEESKRKGTEYEIEYEQITLVLQKRSDSG